MPVWQLVDDGIQENDLVLKDKQKCQQVIAAFFHLIITNIS